MKLNFHRAFDKDLDSIKKEKDRQLIEKALTLLKQTGSLNELPNATKLRGHKNAWRIRAGNYRIGVYLADDAVNVARVAHRKDIYRLFP